MKYGIWDLIQNNQMEEMGGGIDERRLAMSWWLLKIGDWAFFQRQFWACLKCSVIKVCEVFQVKNEYK